MRQKGKGYKGVKVRWQRGPSVAISVIFSYMCCTFLRAHRLRLRRGRSLINSIPTTTLFLLVKKKIVSSFLYERFDEYVASKGSENKKNIYAVIVIKIEGDEYWIKSLYMMVLLFHYDSYFFFFLFFILFCDEMHKRLRLPKVAQPT